MCGIFGMIRSDRALDPDRATAAFAALGERAVERGRDAAGFALVPRGLKDSPHTTPTQRHAGSTDTTIDGIRIIKGTQPFTALWDDKTHVPLVATAKVAIGHTRWATQGHKGSLANASPMVVGALVGTHNGDVDTHTVSTSRARTMFGTTDTEHLFTALEQGRKDRRSLQSTLTTVEGRAALAWVDRERTDRVYLARAALSPLALAYDAERNLYWASNPDWFRQIDDEFGGIFGFHDITMVREGTLLTVEIDGEPFLADARTFTPKCRDSDDRMRDLVVWRGFTAADMRADKAQMNHDVAAPKVSARSSYGGYSGSYSSGGSGGGLYGGYSGRTGLGETYTRMSRGSRWDDSTYDEEIEEVEEEVEEDLDDLDEGDVDDPDYLGDDAESTPADVAAMQAEEWLDWYDRNLDSKNWQWLYDILDVARADEDALTGAEEIGVASAEAFILVRDEILRRRAATIIDTVAREKAAATAAIEAVATPVHVQGVLDVQDALGASAG